MSTGKRYNRLINEKSPYLLQHAENPVDWYPWCEEAFEKAKREDKPIFLSIGYSTCHWCHVMEKESFQDEEVAKILNEYFVCIKVDREERPDIDDLYMTVCQALTGSGGWPLTIIMTPDKKPFFAGTYIPKYTRFGRIGLVELLPRIAQMWQNQREKIYSVANEIVAGLTNAFGKVYESQELDISILDDAFSELERNFDEKYGGFGVAPKFPTPHNLLFLLRYWKRTGSAKALEMVKKTLKFMRLGGIYDHIGFGFHRYSTDFRWLVPHFEKMLYDQSLLAIAYAEAFLATAEKLFEQTSKEILDYVLRNMTNSDGGFFSAEDADSEGEEGKFYLWTKKELEEILKPDEIEFVTKFFNISDEGNFYDEIHGGKTGKNIFHLSNDEIFQDKNFKRWEEIRAKLFSHREKRVHPLKDDKILVDWNGLMICALSKAYQVFGESQYLNIAKRSADFILKNMVTEKGHLLHRFRESEAGIEGFLDDYAFMIWGLVELYQANFESFYLKKAIDLTEKMIELFWDETAGGFFSISKNSNELWMRKKDVYDGAIPSGNSVALLDLVLLFKITGNIEFEQKAVKLVGAFAKQVKEAPSAYTFFLTAFDFLAGPSFEIVIVGEKDSSDTKLMLDLLRRKFIPNKIIILKSHDSEIENLCSYISKYKMFGNKATVYVCRNFTCNRPISDIEEFAKMIE